MKQSTIVILEHPNVVMSRIPISESLISKLSIKLLDRFNMEIFVNEKVNPFKSSM
jgi:hypothetical protein